MPAYFAYGANMAVAAMRRRCPGSMPIGLARLPDHRIFIMIEGYASLCPAPGASVHGLLWDLADADIPALDAYEEVDFGLYAKVVLDVFRGDSREPALVYVGRSPDRGVPVPGYLEMIIAAAREIGLPAAHVETLRALLPD